MGNKPVLPADTPVDEPLARALWKELGTKDQEIVKTATYPIPGNKERSPKERQYANLLWIFRFGNEYGKGDTTDGKTFLFWLDKTLRKKAPSAQGGRKSRSSRRRRSTRRRRTQK